MVKHRYMPYVYFSEIEYKPMLLSSISWLVHTIVLIAWPLSVYNIGLHALLTGVLAIIISILSVKRWVNSISNKKISTN